MQEFPDKVKNIEEKNKEKFESITNSNSAEEALGESLAIGLTTSVEVMGEFFKVIAKSVAPEEDKESQEKIENTECTIM